MQVDFARRIGNGAKHMGELVENMLDLAKMDLHEEGRFETLDLAPMLAELADEFKPQAEAKGQTLTLEKTGTSFPVRGEAVKLRQVFRNLIGNAIKYTPANGTIQISANSDAERVFIHVKDTGYGIPAADLPHLFKRFYRVRNNGHDDIEGNGLGLAIVKSIVEGHGGGVLLCAFQSCKVNDL
jgi:signal transduction histidine kinase